MILGKPSRKQAEKSDELRWLLSFQEKCPAYPRSPPIQPQEPAPDILFPEAELGVEITRYYLGQGKKGSPLRKLESDQEGIIQAAQRRFEALRNDQLQVSVGWIPGVESAKTDRDFLVGGIVQVVVKLLAQGQNCWQPDWTQPDEAALGKHFAKVWVDRLKRDPSFWVCIEAGSLGDDVHRVRVVLDEKESKVIEYRKRCRYIWLLIVAEGRHISSTFSPDEDFEPATFRTSFDHVFILDVFRNLVREVRVEK
jgi:hypothetical protein